ncbi:MAG: hypothetical protein AAF762_08230, partial [Pseudomonadota bacterium]
MKMKILTAAVAAWCSLAASSASATVVYEWSGTCTESCTGTSTAVLTLTDDYTPGTELNDNDFISFSYSNTLNTTPITSTDGFVQINGTLPESSGEAFFDLSQLNQGVSFLTSTSPGFWQWTVVSQFFVLAEKGDLGPGVWS